MRRPGSDLQLKLEYSFDMPMQDEASSSLGAYGQRSAKVRIPRQQKFRHTKDKTNAGIEPFGFYEFFAGGGMARLGLGERWKCAFANEWSSRKASSYRRNFQDDKEVLAICDVAALTVGDLPGRADLAWASFPCQDLSLAGNGAGLSGARSGTFHKFWSLIRALKIENRAPAVVVLENVVGTLTSHGGEDFTSMIDAVAGSGYQVGALVVDAAKFLPQSRPRLFWIAVRAGISIPAALRSAEGTKDWHSSSLLAAYDRLPSHLKAAWVWWNLPNPKVEPKRLAEVMEDSEAPVKWHTKAETEKLISMMSASSLAKLERMKSSGARQVGTIYKRTRPDKESGERLQRAELRDDGLAGCLRTPAGGSSRQIVLIAERGKVRTRLLTAREAARLMGIPEDYELPLRYNDAYHLAGDGLAVPAVSWISEHLLLPLVSRCLPNAEVSAA